LDQSHYSYSAYADPAMARTFDDRRFSGPIGSLVAASQAKVLLEFAGPLAGRSVLDVGTGTGRAAILLTRAGAQVTGVDASEEMLAVARTRSADEGLNVTFNPGDAHALAFGDRSFDVAVSLRVLMHTPEWRRCLSELCRVSRERVIVDYPSIRSVALIESLYRRMSYAAGAKTEPYRVLSFTAIERELAAGGFQVSAVHRQFVLPIAVHKIMASARATEAIESPLARLGLLRLFGSPVTLLAKRCASS
jgi:ubiquinone/menaquinone biosynthesis C-methylase UbiE